MTGPVFLTLAEVLEIHQDQLERYGGEFIAEIKAYRK